LDQDSIYEAEKIDLSLYTYATHGVKGQIEHNSYLRTRKVLLRSRDRAL